MAENKNILTSKTFWYGLLSVAIGVLQATQGELGAGTLFTANGLITVVLRLVTESKIVLK